MNNNVSTFNFDEMQNIDILTVDRESLADIQNVDIDPNLPFIEKAILFLNQIKNPYCFRCGDVVVKINHAKTEKTIDDCMEGFYRSL